MSKTVQVYVEKGRVDFGREYELVVERPCRLARLGKADRECVEADERGMLERCDCVQREQLYGRQGDTEEGVVELVEPLRACGRRIGECGLDQSGVGARSSSGASAMATSAPLRVPSVRSTA